MSADQMNAGGQSPIVKLALGLFVKCEKEFGPHSFPHDGAHVFGRPPIS